MVSQTFHEDGDAGRLFYGASSIVPWSSTSADAPRVGNSNHPFFGSRSKMLTICAYIQALPVRLGGLLRSSNLCDRVFACHSGMIYAGERGR
jgi:hypothetical protein